MQSFADLYLQQDTLAHYGLPDIAYLNPMDMLHMAVANGELPLAVLPLGFETTQPGHGKVLEELRGHPRWLQSVYAGDAIVVKTFGGPVIPHPIVAACPGASRH